MKIGEIVKKYRVSSGLTMQEFADNIGKTKGYISMLEKGRNPQTGRPITPTVDTLKKIASAMDVDFNLLLDQIDDEQTINITPTDKVVLKMRTNQEIIEILKQEKDAQGLSLSELARRVGMAKSAVSRYFNGSREFPLNRAKDFADVLGLSTEYLLGIETTPTDKVRPLFDQLNQDQQGKAVTYIQSLLDEQREVKEPATLYAVNTLDKAAAGLGYDFTDVDYDTYYTDEEPSAHDLATVVDGDSMEPEYQDGDVLLLVDKGFSRFSGQLCVIAYDGKTYFKKVYSEPNGLRLVSLNPAYQDIWLDFPPTDGYIKIFSVVDSFKPVKK